ncbi:response regulator, partial [Neobacillus niacini]|uniref:response regulator n=1 Tax=Neobacillus niacini TaxID=86668 RepID=UPI003000E463
MYKIMLVDDEKLELEMIRDYVDWKQYEIEVVGTAKNGMEALTVAEECFPDIIITDVKMPIMDGLQFSKELRKRNTQVEIIFLSGYDEFSYIKTALQLEVTDYLLKPLDFDELPSVISRAKERLEKRKKEEKSQKVLLEQYMKDLLFNSSLIRKEADMTRQRLVDNDQYFLVIASIDNFSILPNVLQMSHHYYHFINEYISKRAISGIVIEARDGEYGIVLNLGVDKHLDLDRALCDLMEVFFQVFQISITIVLPPNPIVLDEISNVYTTSKNTLQLRFYYGPGKLLKPELINKRKDILIPTIYQDLTTSMLVGDWQKSEELLNSLFNYFIEHEVDRDVICNELYRLLTYLLTNLFNGGHTPPFEKDALKNIFQFDTMTALKHFIEQKIKSLFQYLCEKEGDN